MLEIKIYEDGQLKKQESGEFLVFSLLRNCEDQSTDVTSGILGAGVSKKAVIDALARIDAKVIVEIHDGNECESMIAALLFQALFKKAMDENLSGGDSESWQKSE